MINGLVKIGLDSLTTVNTYKGLGPFFYAYKKSPAIQGKSLRERGRKTHINLRLTCKLNLQVHSLGECMLAGYPVSPPLRLFAAVAIR